ncbi:MAG: metalloregulator ArsR/SmtB family transcription factor [Verrucomicrobia bacterium]|nr:metalloregulator ArsR/SmtB family transcription factor [Verrucomicrobiota bacterium]
MKVSEQELLQLQAEICGMMANPKRLAIVSCLHEGERSVGEIADTLATSISTVSQHLRLMKDRNVVTTRRVGQTIYYRLKNDKFITACQTIRDVLMDELKERAEIAHTMNEEDKEAAAS